MKKVITVFLLGILIIAIIGAALYFLVPSNIKDSALEYLDNDDTMFGTDEGSGWVEPTDTEDFYAERSEELIKEEQTAVDEMNKELDRLDLSEEAKESVRYSMYQEHGKIRHIRDIKHTVKVYAERTGELSK